MKRLFFIILAFLGALSSYAQHELHFRSTKFTCQLGTFINYHTTAKNVDSEIPIQVAAYNGRPYWNFGAYETFVRFNIYISSNNQLDNDVKIGELVTSSLQIELSGNRRQRQYPATGGILKIEKKHVGNGWFGDKMYIIVAKQSGSRAWKNGIVTWNSNEYGVQVHEFNLIERAFVDPMIKVVKAPPSPGSWNYEFRCDNIGTVSAGVNHNWRMRLVGLNGTSTTLTSGNTSENRTVKGDIYIHPSLATPGFPMHFIYFELLPTTDHNRSNNTVKTSFIF